VGVLLTLFLFKDFSLIQNIFKWLGIYLKGEEITISFFSLPIEICKFWKTPYDYVMTIKPTSAYLSGIINIQNILH